MMRRTLRCAISAVLMIPALLVSLPAQAAGPAAQEAVPLFSQLLALLANPNVAYFLFVLGLLGVVAELVTTGMVFPGVIGAICLILALVGLGQLPTNWGGAVLILAGVIMLLLDIKVSGWGLTIGGLIAFALGSLLIFTPFWEPAAPGAASTRLNPWLIVGTTSGVGAFFLLGLSAAIRAHLGPVAMGRHTLVGRVGIVKRSLAPTGIVHLEGEEWSAVSADGAAIEAGRSVRVITLDGLVLHVEPAEAPGGTGTADPGEQASRAQRRGP